VSLEIDLNGHADHWVVIDDENSWHIGHPRLNILFRQFDDPRIVMHAIPQFGLS
jgi:hypothetical protein